MFTGLVQRLGRVLSFRRGVLVLEMHWEDLTTGESVAVNGACLTVNERGRFDVVKETMRKTNLGDLRPGARVNLERALRPADRIGGHFVQGHVDVTGVVRENGSLLRVEVEPVWATGLVPKGSVAVDGVSLTVVDVGRDCFTCALIPHTRKHTTLGRRRPNERVNLEFDILGKYVQKRSRITPEFLRQAGYLE